MQWERLMRLHMRSSAFVAAEGAAEEPSWARHVSVYLFLLHRQLQGFGDGAVDMDGRRTTGTARTELSLKRNRK